MNYIEVIYILLVALSNIYGIKILRISEWEDKEEECGVISRFTNASTSRTDSSAPLGDQPWTAVVGVINEDNSTKTFFCGGTLISRNFVLTTARCGLMADVVRLGENNIDTDTDCDEICSECAPPPQDISVRQHIISDDCETARARSNDLVLLRLAKSADLNDYVQPICLPEKSLGRTLREEDTLTLVGFGVVRSDFDKKRSSKNKERKLKRVIAPIMQNSDCDEVYVRSLNAYMICVGYHPSAGPHSCLVDTGGPLIKEVQMGQQSKSVLVGVASYGNQFCDKGWNLPMVFTDVSSYSDWILEKLKESKHKTEK